MMKNIVFAAVVLCSGCFASKKNLQAQPPFQLPEVKSVSFKKDTFNIVRAGAVADGVTLNTVSIQKSIDECHAKGGGVVLVPSGQFITGPLELKSNVNLHLAHNAMLLFTQDFSQYKLIRTNWEGLGAVRNQSPISATKATNIAITGNGIIDGGGEAWRMVKKEKQTESQWKKLLASGGVLSENKKSWYPSESSKLGNNTPGAGVWKEGAQLSDYEKYKDFMRPNMLVLTQCDQVLLEGVTFQNSAAWCLHPLMSTNITIRNLFVKNPWYAQNGDGLDLESCSNVIIENSVFDVGDDGICIKSGRDEQGRQRAMPTQNVLVKHCTVYQAHGGFVIGSEMSGGAKNIFVTDCNFIGTDIGLRFKTTRGRGGIVENIYIQNIHMSDIVGDAILFDMYYAAKDPVPLAGEERALPKVEMKPVSKETPQFRDFTIRNIVSSGSEKAVFIRGLPEMHVKNIRFSDMVLKANKGIEMSEASGISFHNVKILSKESAPVIDVVHSDNIVFNGITVMPEAELVYRMGGDRLKKIEITNTTAQDAKKKIEYEFGASPDQVKMK